ncbi:MAG: alkaline phosphatase family protein [Phycisphaerae bacterium]
MLIIGLDGATFDVLCPLMAEGRMPRLKAAMDSGASGVLRSTVPPITPAAWTTFLTGKQPGTHGIIDFERYDVQTNRLTFNSTRSLAHVRTLWQLVGDCGLRVGSINVPMTYPATQVNGFMISGFETPGPAANFVYPPELKKEVLQAWPDPTLKTKWQRRSFGGRQLFKDNVGYIVRSFHQGAHMAITVGDRLGWDVLMVVLKLVDNLQHKTWRYIDQRWSSRDPARRDITRAAFEELDRAVGALLDYADANNARTLIVSDHGHGSLEGKVQPNMLLKDWGYLTLRRGGAQPAARIRHTWDRLRRRNMRFAREGDIAHDLAVDFSRTRACVMHAGMAGFLYLNLRGRQPSGIVEPAEYDTLRDELERQFLGDRCRATDPAGRAIQLFSAVHRPEELYGCTREDQPWLPDLLLIPHESLAVIRKIRGRRPVRWLPPGRIEGTHRSNGILIASGPGIARGVKVDAHIVDCAPTILAMLGLAIPGDMEGHVITGLFDATPAIKSTAARPSAVAQEADANNTEVYTAEELQQVTERLMDLGYLE